MCHNLFNQSPDDRNLGYFLSFLITKKKGNELSLDIHNFSSVLVYTNC